MSNVFAQIVDILNESSPYLLLGFFLAGLFHVVLTRFPRLTALFTGRGARPVLMSTILGLPMPLCSCSVLPAAMTLRRKGASKGATASFLVSVPETDVVSILLTLALLGGVMAVYRPLAALFTALAVGLLINALDRGGDRSEHAPGQASGCAHCESDGPEKSILSSTGRGPWWRRALHYGFVEIFDDIIAQLFLGILVAGALMAWLPGFEIVARASGALWTYLLMLVIGVPVYVCAVASTPVAAGLIAGGVSPGAAMVFLLAGPATNIASLFVLRGEFGKRALGVYLGAIAAGSVAMGLLFDLLLRSTVSAATVAERHAHHDTSALQIAATVVFLALVLASFKRIRIVSKIKSSVLRLAPRASTD
ncbi:MAG: SO_0444 family Cu/Zn efflux transporter [Candidatus Krumholzibacteria bacterium]|nr:SO_0444 family Cu/Zn efflux transporter [Candidatus Krumholzibacteria bacterium]